MFEDGVDVDLLGQGDGVCGAISFYLKSQKPGKLTKIRYLKVLTQFVLEAFYMAEVLGGDSHVVN